MTKVKKLTLIIFSVLLISIFLYNFMYGNPISKSIATKDFTNYIETTYPNENFKIRTVNYCFKTGNYDAEIISDELGIHFVIGYTPNNSIYDEYKSSTILIDSDMSNRFSQTIEDYICNDLRNPDESNIYNLPFVTTVSIAIPQGKYKDITTQYDVSMDDPFVINISLFVDDINNYKEDLKEVIEASRNAISKRNYNGFAAITVNIQSNDSCYYISLSRDELQMKINDLENYIHEGVSSI